MSKVFVEGKTDLVFVKSLGFSKKDVRVLDNKGGVCNYLSKHTKIIGLVDEDPSETPPKYLQKLKKEELEYDLLLYQDSNNSNKIIALRPRLEEWLIKVCKNAGVKMNEPANPNYELKLPDKSKELHDYLPQHPEQLKKLVAQLLEIKNPPILLLQSHLVEK